MHELTRLSQPLIERPAAPPPELFHLRRRVAAIRRRRRAVVGGCVATLLGVVAIGVDRRLPDSPPLEVATGEHSAAPVPTLANIGPEMVVASGTLADGTDWRAVVYEVAPAEGRSEPRFCTELRSEVDGPQSCFPVFDNPDSGIQWSYVERHAGELFLVVATDPATVAELDDVPLDPQAGQDGLPVRLAVALLSEKDDGYWLQDGPDGGGGSIGADGASGMAAPGVRLQGTLPAIPGVFFERLTSDNPERDRWVSVFDGQGSVGYINPSDFHDLPTLPEGGSGLPVEEQPDPVYDSSGQRIAWFDGCVYTTGPDCDRPGEVERRIGQ